MKIMFLNYKIKFFIAFTIFLVSFLLLAKVLSLSYLPDFTNYYYGAKHIVNNENPYINDLRYFTDQSYPPFTLLLFMPFTITSLEIASKLWTVISLTIILVCLLLIYKIHKESFFSPINLILASLVFLSFPVKFSLGMGQINFLVLLFLVLTVYFFNQKRYDSSGFFLGFPLAIKFFPLLLVPYFFLIKNWKIMRSLLLVIFLTVCLTYIFFSFHAVLYYFTQILPDLLTSWKGDYYNQSVTGSVMRGVQDPTVQQIVRWGIVFLLLISLLFVFFKEKRNTKELVNLKISAVIVFSLLVNSFSWQHHFVWLFIPFFIMTFYIKKLERSKKYYILLGICYLLVASNMKNPSLFPVFLQSHVFYGGILLYGINLYLLYKHKVYFLKKKK